MRMEGRTVIVTGGAQGIGRGIATRLAQEGASVMIGDLNPDGAEETATELKDAGLEVAAHMVDVSLRDSTQDLIATTVARFGRLDVMFNNAGFNEPMRFLDVTEENFRRILEVNALGVLIGTQEAARQFLAQRTGGEAVAGKVVNTASIAGRTGFPDFAPYSASKAAVISLTQAAARALAPHGITVNGFAPGVVATPLWTKLDADLERIGAGDTGFDSMSSSILLGRPAQP